MHYEGKGNILKRRYVAGAVDMTVEVPESLARRLTAFEKKK